MLINSLVSIKKQAPLIPYEDDEELPFISIFIPAHNEENTIEATVRSICNSEYYKDEEYNYEVIVINDGSTDSTGEILAELKKDIPQLKIVTRHPPRSGKGKGFVLNDALTLSRGEIIGVFDADTQIKTDYLTTIVQYLHGDIDGVQSRVRMFNKDENYLARMQHIEFASFGNTLIAKDNLGSTGFLGGNGQFVKKDAIINSGRWDGFAVTEDLNLAIKIILNGGKIRYCGECSVYQEAVTEWKAFFRQRVRWAIGNFETLFVYLPQILRAKISIPKKFNIIEHISFYSFNLLIFFGFLITIANAISWFIFHDVTMIRMEAPFVVGVLSVIAFFPGIILALSRDKPGAQEFIKDIVKYYIYCFHLIPLFFMTMKTMITRKERRWAKTEHKGGKK
ncbi:MAG: glycosyltransferase family 2 protein [Methanobrevibacter sp.]|nr:glycosyltransferase family 2 protein [Methanobrevibacter sp.]